uniref:Saposin B-type domain-containing protein n=1 Tax=Aegilops tauschii subsp. strangulata TaxID=200361 RepID=A0A453QPB0_AEGTS
GGRAVHPVPGLRADRAGDLRAGRRQAAGAPALQEGAGDRDHRHRGECVQPEEAGGGLDAPDRHRRERRQARELVDQDEEGHCNSECKTIERACQEVMGYADTDVAEFVYTNKPSVDQLIKFVCKDITKACAADPPPVPKDRIPGEPFAAKPSKDAEMEKIMRSMERACREPQT